MATPIIFPHIEIEGVKYPRVTLHWYVSTGDSSWADVGEFREFQCAEVVTEGFVFDIFELEGRKFVRTFASYIEEGEEGPTFGDRGCFPVDILTGDSQHIIKIAELYVRSRG